MTVSSIDQSLFSRISRRAFEGKGAILIFVFSVFLVLGTACAYFGVVRFVDLEVFFIADAGWGIFVFFLLSVRIFDIFKRHRRNIKEGSLNRKLGLLFTFTSLMPALFMAFFSLFLFHYGVQSWFSTQIKTAVLESNTIAESYLAEHQNTIRADILAMASDLDRQYDIFVNNPVALKKMMDTQIFYRNLSEAVIVDRDMKALVHSGFNTPDLSWISAYDMKVPNIETVTILNHHKEDKVYAIVSLDKFSQSSLLVGRPIDATVLDRVDKTKQASEAYTDLEKQSQDIQRGLILIYIVLSLVLIIISILFAFYVSKRFTRPVGSLVQASNRVRAGDFDLRLKEKTGIGELDQLIQAYNKMADQLSKQHKDLISINRQLDERRIFIETVLGGVSSGILSIDQGGVVRLCNHVATSILNKSEAELKGTNIVKIFPELKKELKKGLAYSEGSSQSFDKEISYVADSDGEHKKDLFVQIVSRVMNDANMGVIITFDDVSNLKSAQRNAAWADVARRIAHEIKNPLTPIQLSAERLGRRFSSNIPEKDREVFSECIEVISKHVDDIGEMVSEFSSFARMPEPKLRKTDLSKLIKQSVVIQQQASPEITIELKGALNDKQPMFAKIDEQLVRQAFVNILQNAMDATCEKNNNLIHVALYRHDKRLIISVFDSGVGFPTDKDLNTFLDPYITFKKGGTGLGLAIVNKIMGDHDGQIVLGQPAWMSSLEQIENSIQDKALSGAIVSLILPDFYNKNKDDDK